MAMFVVRVFVVRVVVEEVCGVTVVVVVFLVVVEIVMVVTSPVCGLATARFRGVENGRVRKGTSRSPLSHDPKQACAGHA